MLIEKSELCGLIPHAGTMCLLGGVLDWDEDSITCIATSHLDADNPLRHAGQLASVHLLEYGAQSIAVHGALLARRSGTTQGSGYLAALQAVELQREYLDGITTPLEIRAQRIASAAECLLYSFGISTGPHMLATARATIFLQEFVNTQDTRT